MFFTFGHYFCSYSIWEGHKRREDNRGIIQEDSLEEYISPFALMPGSGPYILDFCPNKPKMLLLINKCTHWRNFSLCAQEKQIKWTLTLITCLNIDPLVYFVILVQYWSFWVFFTGCFIVPTGLYGRNHQHKVCPVWSCSSTCLSSAPSLVWMWVMRASGGCFIRPACVRSGFPRGSWYVVRPSCLVQPLHGSIAAPVTNSWPLRGVWP